MNKLSVYRQKRIVGELVYQCRRSNRPGNSQAKGPLFYKIWREMRKHPPKG